MDSPASIPATSILSRATVQTAEGNEFNNTGGNMTKIIVQNFTIDPGSTQAEAEMISDTSSEGCENPVSDQEVDWLWSDTHRSLDIYTFISFFLSLIFTRAPRLGAEETTCLDEPPVLVSEIPLDDPLALPIPEASCSPSHKYTRSMLEKGIGYPLYEPQPDCEPSFEYWGKGVRVGDVGIVTADGIFDFLFNVCPSQNPSINPPTIPDDFIEELDCQVRVVEHFQPNACLFSSGVNRSQDPGGSYTCLGPNGAILELPVGATRFEAKDKLPLKRLAARDAEKWYRYTILNMGRDVQNGSLYLVTTCIKCTYWGIAVFERPSAPDCLRFIIDEGLAEQNQALRSMYSWEGFGAFITRVTPNPNNLGSNDGDTLNQCVFLRGYKIELRKDIWDNLESPQSTAKFYTTPQFANKSTRKGNSGNQNDCSRSGPSSAFGTTNLAQDVIMHGTMAFPAEPERVTVHADFSSPPVHPSDLINAALLSQRVDARVALTHDDDWCDMIQGNFSKLKHENLSKIALSYTSMLDEFGCVSLERTGQLTEKQNESTRSFKADHELKTHPFSQATQGYSSYIRNQSGINKPPDVEASGNPTDRYIEEYMAEVQFEGLGGLISADESWSLTEEELAGDLGLRSINPNDKPPFYTAPSIPFPPPFHLTSDFHIPDTFQQPRHQSLTYQDQIAWWKRARELPAAGKNPIFIPQRIYKPHTPIDIKRYVEEVSLDPPIFFWMDSPEECGISLTDSLHGRTKRLRDHDKEVFEGRGPGVSIRLEWPGYRQWSRHMPTKDFYKSPPRPISLAKLCKNVAKCVQRFIAERQHCDLEDGTDPRWKVGGSAIRFEDLVLVSLHHVSIGSWQPQLRFSKRMGCPSPTEREYDILVGTDNRQLQATIEDNTQATTAAYQSSEDLLDKFDATRTHPTWEELPMDSIETWNARTAAYQNSEDLVDRFDDTRTHPTWEELPMDSIETWNAQTSESLESSISGHSPINLCVSHASCLQSTEPLG